MRTNPSPEVTALRTKYRNKFGVDWWKDSSVKAQYDAEKAKAEGKKPKQKKASSQKKSTKKEAPAPKSKPQAKRPSTAKAKGSMVSLKVVYKRKTHNFKVPSELAEQVMHLLSMDMQDIKVTRF